MGLLHVHLTGTNVSDLSPLQGMPIDEISFDFKRERDAEFLRSMKTVRKINNKPAAEFLKDFDGAKDRK